MGGVTDHELTGGGVVVERGSEVQWKARLLSAMSRMFLFSASSLPSMLSSISTGAPLAHANANVLHPSSSLEKSSATAAWVGSFLMRSSTLFHEWR